MNNNIAKFLNNAKNQSLGIAMFIDMGINSNGNLGGVSGADSTCNTRASIYGVQHGNRPWKAFLSTSTFSAICHIQGIDSATCETENLQRPVFAYRVGLGTTCDTGDGSCTANEAVYVAANFDDLLKKNLVNAISDPGQNFPVWSGTNSDGANTGSNCTDWTLNVGGAGTTGNSADTNGSGWFSGSAPTCATFAHVACFQQITE